MSRLDEIESFIAVANSGSITQAAVQLGVAKSAVSRRLSDLETRLGVQLILRTTRQSSLTEEGITYLEQAGAALDALNAADDDLRQNQLDLSGKLRMTVPSSFGLTELQPIFAKFLKANPNIELSIDFSDRMVDIVQEGFDLAIRAGTMPPSSLIVRTIAKMGMRCCASPAFWAEHGTPKTIHDLADLPMLCHHSMERHNGLPYQTPDGTTGRYHPTPRVRSSDGVFLSQMAQQGVGYMIDPNFLTNALIADGKLIEVLDDYIWPELDIFAVLPGTRRATRRTRAFVDFLKSELRG